MTEQELTLKIKATWKPILSFLGPVSGTPYSVWRSPDGKWEVEIHDLDGHIVRLRIVETGQMLLNPRDLHVFLQLLRKELT